MKRKIVQLLEGLSKGQYHLEGLLNDQECQAQQELEVLLEGYNNLKKFWVDQKNPQARQGIKILVNQAFDLIQKQESWLAEDRGVIFLKSWTGDLAIKLIDSEFPDYKQVIPKNNPKRAIVPRRALLEVAKAMAALKTKTGAMVLTFSKNTLLIEVPEGTLTQELIVDTAIGDFEIGISAQYLSEALAVSDAIEVTLTFSDDISSIEIFYDNDPLQYALIMPVRV